MESVNKAELNPEQIQKLLQLVEQMEKLEYLLKELLKMTQTLI